MGWGLAVTGLVDRSIAPHLRGVWIAPHLFVLGLVTVTALGMLANFWLPMTENAGLLTLILGLASFLLQWRRISNPATVLMTLWLAIAWVWLVLPFEQFSFDAGLYHLQFMQWIASEPVFSGLAQLQTRFGFDSSWLLFVATQRINLVDLTGLDVSPWVHYVSVEIMLRALLFWWSALAIRRAILDKDSHSGTVWLHVSLVLMLSIYLWRMKETSTDVAPNVMCVAAWLCGYQAWVGDRMRDATLVLRSFVVMLFALTFVIVSKLSVLPMVLLVIPVWWHLRATLKSLLLPVALLSGMVLLWVVRNFIISGCFVYPAAITCTTVPWSLGAKQAAFEAWDITTFARLYDVSPNKLVRDYVTNFSLNWLSLWAPNFARTFYFRAPVAGVVVGLAAGLCFYRRRLPMELSSYLQVSIVLGIFGFCYWLVLGPDPRFSWAFPFIICLSVMTLGLARVPVTYLTALRGRVAHKLNLGKSLSVVCILVLMLTILKTSNFSFAQDFKTEYAREEYLGRTFWLMTGGIGLCGDKIPCTTHFHDGLVWVIR